MSSSKTSKVMRERNANGNAAVPTHYSHYHFLPGTELLPNLFSPSFAPLSVEPTSHTLLSSSSIAESNAEREEVFTREDRIMLRLLYQQQQLIFTQLGTLSLEMQMITNRLVNMENLLHNEHRSLAEQTTTSNSREKGNRSENTKLPNQSVLKRVSRSNNEIKKVQQRKEQSMTSSGKVKKEEAPLMSNDAYTQVINISNKSNNKVLNSQMNVIDRSNYAKMQSAFANFSNHFSHNDNRNTNSDKISKSEAYNKESDSRGKQYSINVHNKNVHEDHSINTDTDPAATSYYSVTNEIRSCTPPHEQDEMSYCQSALNNSIESYTTIWDPIQLAEKQNTSSQSAALSSRNSVLGHHDNPLLNSQYTKDSNSTARKNSLTSSDLLNRTSHIPQVQALGSGAMAQASITETRTNLVKNNNNNNNNNDNDDGNGNGNNDIQKQESYNIYLKGSNHPIANSLKKPVLTSHLYREYLHDHQERPIPPYQRVYEQQQQQQQQQQQHRYSNRNKSDNNYNNIQRNQSANSPNNEHDNTKRAKENNYRNTHVCSQTQNKEVATDVDKVMVSCNNTDNRSELEVNKNKALNYHINKEVKSSNRTVNDALHADRALKPEKKTSQERRPTLHNISEENYVNNTAQTISVSQKENEKQSELTNKKQRNCVNTSTLYGKNNTIHKKKSLVQQDEHEGRCEQLMNNSSSHDVTQVTSNGNNIATTDTNVNAAVDDFSKSVSDEELSDGYGSYESREYLKQAGLLK